MEQPPMEPDQRSRHRVVRDDGRQPRALRGRPIVGEEAIDHPHVGHNVVVAAEQDVAAGPVESRVAGGGGAVDRRIEHVVEVGAARDGQLGHQRRHQPAPGVAVALIDHDQLGQRHRLLEQRADGDAQQGRAILRRHDRRHGRSRHRPRHVASDGRAHAARPRGFAGVGREPRPRAGQPLLQRDGRLPAESAARAGDVEDAAREVPGRSGRIDRRDAHPRDVTERATEGVDRGPAAGADVEDRRLAAGDGARLGGEIGAHDVIDVDEVADLSAGAEDRRRQAGQDPLDEDRHHARLVARVLARPVHVGVAQDDALEAAGRRVVREVVLDGQHRHRIGGAGPAAARLVGRSPGLVVEGGAGGGEHDPAHPVAPGRVHHVEGAEHGDLGVTDRVVDRAVPVEAGGLVTDDLRSLGGEDVVQLAAAHVDTVRAHARRRRRRRAGADVVHDRHLVPLGHAGLHQVGVDEPGASGDEDAHAGPQGAVAPGAHIASSRRVEVVTRPHSRAPRRPRNTQATTKVANPAAAATLRRIRSWASPVRLAGDEPRHQPGRDRLDDVEDREAGAMQRRHAGEGPRRGRDLGGGVGDHRAHRAPAWDQERRPARC